MATSCIPKSSNEDEHDSQYSSIKEEATTTLSTLPSERALPGDVYQYKGYWLDKRTFLGCWICHKYFKAQQPTNIMLASQPKCGTTWLKALIFTIMNRNQFDFATHPLLSSNPHDCIPFLENYITSNLPPPNPIEFPILATHIPYALLPESIIRNSDCPIIYIAREPKDAFASRWNFIHKLRINEPSSTFLNEQVDMFCEGISNSGPWWVHILEYWKASLELPNKVMFIKYEDLKTEPDAHVKRMAEFVGLPFSAAEEQDGVIQKVIDLCSFDNLKNLEVNQGEVFKPNSTRNSFMNYAFFGQGKVGGYKDLLTEDMIKRIDEVAEWKFKDSRLVFN